MTAAELLRGGHPPLIDVLMRIAAQPHTSAVVVPRVVTAHEAGALQADELDRVLDGMVPAGTDRPEVRVRGRGYRFDRVIDHATRPTLDNTPNRFVKHVVLRLRAQLQRHGEAALVTRMDHLLGVFRDVSTPRTLAADDPVLLHHPLYRRVLADSARI